eukprot:353332-Chlamydomonas_euryale.AAC.1
MHGNNVKCVDAGLCQVCGTLFGLSDAREQSTCRERNIARHITCMWAGALEWVQGCMASALFWARGDMLAGVTESVDLGDGHPSTLQVPPIPPPARNTILACAS